MMIEDRPSKESVAAHLRNLADYEGWRMLLYHWNAEREKIISEGKAARADEKGKKMWATLEGFDRAATMVERLIKVAGPMEDINPLEND